MRAEPGPVPRPDDMVKSGAVLLLRTGMWDSFRVGADNHDKR